MRDIDVNLYCIGGTHIEKEGLREAMSMKYDCKEGTYEVDLVLELL